MKRLLSYLISFIYSVVFNFKVFPFRTAIKIPVIISWKTKWRVYGSIRLEMADIHFGIIRLGIANGSYDRALKYHNTLLISPDASLVFRGTAHIAGGFSINLEKILLFVSVMIFLRIII